MYPPRLFFVNTEMCIILYKHTSWANRYIISLNDYKVEMLRCMLVKFSKTDWNGGGTRNVEEEWQW